MTDHTPHTIVEIATLVGQVCLEWADIEYEVKIFAMTVAFLPGKQSVSPDMKEALSIALSYMDIRQKVATAKALAYMGDNVFSVFDRAEPILNLIDNDLRIERNRYIHDEWFVYPDQIMRIKE